MQYTLLCVLLLLWSCSANLSQGDLPACEFEAIAMGYCLSALQKSAKSLVGIADVTGIADVMGIADVICIADMVGIADVVGVADVVSIADVLGSVD